MTKSIFASKTFWLNLIAGLITLIGGLNTDLLAAIGINNPTQFMSLMGVLVMFMNFILRMLTNEGVHIITPTDPK